MRSAAFFLLLLIGPLGEVLEVQSGALERLLGHCNFAYLEHPRISGETGRLRIRAGLIGRGKTRPQAEGLTPPMVANG